MTSNTKLEKRKTTKIDYTLEQFLAEVKHREHVNKVLDRMVNTLDRLDKRVSKLEKKKCP